MNWWRRLSIAAKLPLGMGTLLLLVLGGMSAIVYADLREAAYRSAEMRLGTVTPNLAEAVRTSTRSRVEQLRALARNEAVARFLATGGDSLRERALAAVREYMDDDDSTVELWDAEGRRLLGTPGDTFPLEPLRLAESVEGLGPGTAAAIGPILGEGGHAVLSVIASLREGETLLGYITDRRPITSTPEGMRAMTDLVGAESRILIGNAAGDMWTDLAGVPAPPPPLDVAPTDAIVEYVRDDTAVIARGAAILGTPWLLLIELPRGPVYASATRFLNRALFLTLALAGAGALVAWFMSRRMSLPLVRVTDAAEALASGRDVDEVPVTRSDEIGRLAASFNSMADQVVRSRDALEQRVAERTVALQSANHELESFSYSVSHDLRAPLRAVDGFAAILAEDHADELSPDARRYLDRIRLSAQQMGMLIDDLLAFSRLGRQPIGRKPVDMEALARDVVDDACRAERRDPAEFEIEPLPPAVGERSMLKQVFANLVQNALKFTRGRQPASISIGASVSDGETVYFVRDDGVGFDMRYADKLFGVFQRLHPPEEFEGTGVGLAVVKRVVERHGGRVWAESAPGDGATFRFTIPLDAQPPEGEERIEGDSWK